MGLFQQIGFTSPVTPAIDWDLLPDETFAIFESWGGKERVKSAKERFYYFYIDTWENPPTLYLMERGIKFAKVLARIKAPQDMIDNAVAAQGKTMGMDKSYAIDAPLKSWLQQNVVDSDDVSFVIPIQSRRKKESMKTGLPGKDTPLPQGLPGIVFPARAPEMQENDVATLVKKGNFFDSQYNPTGGFTNFLVDNNDGLTVTDKRTGIMWQRAGCDITSIRKILAYIHSMNTKKLAGFNDWRLPTMEEALSLLEPKHNEKGLHLHKCFSVDQPFIFLAEKRNPGGYWFCDFKQGTLFWASGTIPGGFGRLCRTNG